MSDFGRVFRPKEWPGVRLMIVGPDTKQYEGVFDALLLASPPGTPWADHGRFVGELVTSCVPSDTGWEFTDE